MQCIAANGLQFFFNFHLVGVPEVVLQGMLYISLVALKKEGHHTHIDSVGWWYA